MQKLTITLTKTQYDLACRRLLDPQAHLQNFAECMVHHAMQERGHSPQADGSYSDADTAAVLTLPTVKELEDKHIQEAEIANKEALQLKGIADAEQKEADRLQAAKDAQVAAQKAIDDKAFADKQTADNLAAQAQREADIEAAARAMVQRMMPDIVASVTAQVVEQAK
jgi:hypothetical protein